MKIENTKTIIYYTKEDIETIDKMIEILDTLSKNAVICEQYSGIYISHLATCIEAIRYDLFDTKFQSDLIELRQVTHIPSESARVKEYTVDDLLGDDYPF